MDPTPDVLSVEARLARAHLKLKLLENLLELTRSETPESFVQEVLALLVEHTEASQGYIELRATQDPSRIWEAAHRFDAREAAAVRQTISTGVIAKAIADKEPIRTRSALNHPDLRNRTSVRAHAIDHVLCTPVSGAMCEGVIYLQGRARGGAFSEDDVGLTHHFANHLSIVAERLLLQRGSAPDPTAALRERLKLPGIAGRSPALEKALSGVEEAARFDDFNVLLSGPTGSGKSTFARLIHMNGARAGKPFIEMNCAALPEGLIESELFGTTRGAGAHLVDRPGKVEAAEGGTLFLDEIGDASPGLQAKLLRLVGEKTFERLGSNKAKRADVRILSATWRDLPAEIARGAFREDLYFRLRGMEVRVPGLQERSEDLALLAEEAVTRMARKNNVAVPELSPGATLALQCHDWQGAVRELENILRGGLVAATRESSPVIEARHLFPERDEDTTKSQRRSYHAELRRWKHNYCVALLEEFNNNVEDAAQAIDLHRSSLYRLMKSAGVER